MIDERSRTRDRGGAEPFPGTVEVLEERVQTAMIRVVPTRANLVEARRAHWRKRHVLPTPLDRRLSFLAAPDSRRAESFRHLRDNLLGKDLPRVLAVTSAAAREGKTACAINLALAFAERALTDVLLVDGNLDEPSFAEIFGIDESTPALPSTNPSWIAPYKIVEVVPRLHVAAIVRPAGERRPRIDPRWFDLIIGHFSAAGCDPLIVDTPALESAPVARHVVAAADAAIVTVKSGATTARALRAAIQRIGSTKALGVALMDSDESP